MRKPDESEDLIAKARFSSEPPILFGDVGQDDAFATESNPEGLRYGEKPHPPGSVEHGNGAANAPLSRGLISIG